MNNFAIAGYVGGDARSRTVTVKGEDRFVVNFNVGVNDGKKGGEKQTLWVSVVGWGDFFQGVSPYLKKGTFVTVIGRAGIEPAKDGYEAKQQLTASNIELGPGRSGGDAAEEPADEEIAF